MGAGRGKARRTQDVVGVSNGSATAVFDIKRAVESDKTGLAGEVVRAFHKSDNNSSQLTAVIGEKEDRRMAYIISCDVADGIEVTNMLVDGKWNLGAHFSLREDGTWSVKAFSFDSKKQEEVTSRSRGGSSTGDTHLANLRKDVNTITDASAWGDPKTAVEILQSFM